MVYIFTMLYPHRTINILTIQPIVTTFVRTIHIYLKTEMYSSKKDQGCCYTQSAFY
jgi:hypothetical protein